MEQLFRHRVLRMLLEKGLILPERVRMLLGWKHSGFNLDTSVRVRARDTTGRENISRYLIRAPFSVEKVRYWPKEGRVIYKTKMVKGPNRNFQFYDPLDFLAAVTAHIPNRREHLVRYYGFYSSVQRGQRRRMGLESPGPGAPVILEEDTPSARTARRSWARLIRKIYEVDPLVCPRCGLEMRIIAFLEEPQVVEKILRHLRLWDQPEPRPPPVPQLSPLVVEFEYVPDGD